MRPSFRVLALSAAVTAIACDQYKEPAPPRDVKSVAGRAGDMAWSGIDMSGSGYGRAQRSNMAGTNSDTDDNRAMGSQLGESTEGTEGTGSIGGEHVGSPGAGRGSTNPHADLDTLEMRNAQRGGQVYKPSDHYFVNGVDLGPSWDAAPGTGGPSKLKNHGKAPAAAAK